MLLSRRKRGPTIAAGLAVVALVAALAVVSLQYRTTLMRAAQNRTARLSFLLAEQAARTFESVDFTLRGFEPLLDGEHPMSVPDLDALLKKRVSELSFVDNMRVMDLHGDLLAASGPDPARDAARPDGCVAVLAAPAAPALAIGCGVGDVGLTGRPSIAVARRLGATDGKPARIIVADVDPGYFSHFFRDLGLGPHTVVTLTESHGHVLLASAEPAGDDRAAPALVPPTQQARLAELQRETRGKISAVHATDGYPLSVLVAMNRGDVEREWRQTITPAAVLTAAVSCLLFLLARVIERQRTEREEARRRAMVAQKLEVTGQMTASVAHDFRNILTVMQGTLHLIRRRGADAAILAEADGTVQRGNAMVDRLLAFSRRAELRAEPHDVNDLVRRLESTLRHVVGAEMKLVVDLADPLPACRIDRLQFEAALMNLVVNARQAMQAGGTVSVRSRPDAAGATVAVIDTGCGIDAATLTRVFEPFFTTKAEHGTGLGLAQVQAFAEQTGGAVTVDSVVGAGTTVTLHLPRAAAQPVKPAPVRALTLDPA